MLAAAERPSMRGGESDEVTELMASEERGDDRSRSR